MTGQHPNADRLPAMSDTEQGAASWKQTGALGSINYILECDGFYISYNPDPSASIFGTSFASDDSGPETALCGDGAFHILNGDYRSQYEKLAAQGWEACKQFYDQQSAHAGSSWSSRAKAQGR